MEEYICKNSSNQKAFSICLHEFYFEIDRNGTISTVEYTLIQSVRLKKRGTRFTLIIHSDSADYAITNRFYFLNGTYEDRSKKYTSFVQSFHARLQKRKKINFYASSFWLASFFNLRWARYDPNNIPADYLPS